MSEQNQYQTKIVNTLLDKFVSEEIMTKSEFKVQIDEIMTRHEHKIDQKFDKIEHSISNTIRWNVGIAISAVLAVAGVIVALLPLLHK